MTTQQTATDTELLEWLVHEGYVFALRRIEGGWLFETEPDDDAPVYVESRDWRAAIIAAREAQREA